MQNRENVLKSWINHLLGNIPYTLTPLAGDASFRRYFRLQYENTRRILMDAPPDRENIIPFVDIATRLCQTGIAAPRIHAMDEQAGFLLLDDFGDAVLLPALNPETVSDFYQSALDTLITMQQCPTDNLPAFDKKHMLQETALFKAWFLEQYLHLELTPAEKTMIQETIDHLLTTIEAQPQVFIHRDYHSRNLMVLPDKKLGVLDFQDAMRGPATYDLVSLLKDCYIAWPREKVLDWAFTFHAACPAFADYPAEKFVKDFDYCGLQRHLKVLGIFCRLYLRDHKAGYLLDLPRVLQYTLDATALYEPLHPLHDFIRERVKLP